MGIRLSVLNEDNYEYQVRNIYHIKIEVSYLVANNFQRNYQKKSAKKPRSEC